MRFLRAAGQMLALSGLLVACGSPSPSPATVPVSTASAPAPLAPSAVASATAAATATATAAATTVPPARRITRAEAEASVRALPEFADLKVGVIGNRKVVPVVVLVAEPTATCLVPPCVPFWEFAAGDKMIAAADGKLNEQGPVELWVRVDAKDGSLSLAAAEAKRVFLPQARWNARKKDREWGQALVTSLPEFRAMSSARAGSLGIMVDGEPPEPCAADCQWVFMALRVCSGCAGHWERFTFDPAAGTLFVGDLDLVPYGTWRNEFRNEGRSASAPSLRANGAAKNRFPDLKAGDGAFGYGTPTQVDKDPKESPLTKALTAPGLKLLRAESYGPTFRVFVLEGTSLPAGPALRAWAASVVRANGGAACEISVGADRYQFDASAVYVLRKGAFHPWFPRP
jgi:hypothetical protein